MTRGHTAAMRRGALLLVALAQLGALCLPAPAAAQGRGSLHLSDVPLSGRARQVGFVAWQGRPAVWAFVTRPDGDALLHVFIMRARSIQQVALWPLPWATAWVQPMARRGSHPVWLAHVAGAWRLGSMADGALSWRAACACASPYPARDNPGEAARFVFDLNDDGTDEVLLPERDTVAAYALDAADGALRLLWRDAWRTELRGELRGGQRREFLELPRYTVQDLDGDGTGDLVVQEATQLTVTSHPPAAAWLVPGGAPPATALEAVAVPLPGIGPAGNGAFAEVLAQQDVNRDGVPDVVHYTVSNMDSVLRQKSVLRWFAGSRQGGTYALREQRPSYRTDGPGFALLERAGVDPGSAPVLIVASADTSLAATARALGSGLITLSIGVHPWRGPRPVRKPVAEVALDFSARREGGAPPTILAVDLDGDGWREAVLNPQAGQVRVYRGTPQGPALHREPMAEGDFRLPERRERNLIGELNGEPGEEWVLWFRDNDLSDAVRSRIQLVRLN